MTFFGLQNLKLIDFTKIFQFKGLKPKKGHSNFYECCDLTKKYIQRSCSIAKRQRRMRRTKMKIKTLVSVGLTICQDFLSQISLEIQITALVIAQWTILNQKVLFC